MKIPNITKYVPNAVSQKVGRAALHVSKQSPHLLFGVGVVGVVATVVMASKATLKVEPILAKTKEQLAGVENARSNPKYTDQDAKTDTALIHTQNVVALGKLYGPTVAVGLTSIAFLTGAHVVLTKRNIAITAAYKASEKAFKEYRDRVEKKYGPEKERELRYDAVEDPKNKKGIKQIGPEGVNQYAVMFDETNRNWNPNDNYNRIFLKCQQNMANDILISRGHIFLNEVYHMLGFDPVPGGQIVGWVLHKNHENFVDFGLTDDRESVRRFVNGHEQAVLLDFNLDGIVFDKI